MGGAALIARNLGAQRQGNNWRCPCPLECGYALSLTDGEDGRLLAYCHGGCDFHDVLAALVEHGLLDDDDARLSDETSVRERTAEDRQLRIDSARWIYTRQSTDDTRLVHTYLRSRGITLSSPVLRFCPSAPHRLGMRLPAMVAPVVDVDGEHIGTHLTYLRPDGRAKANLPKEFQRETRGVIHGGAIRLAPHDPDCELLIGEGVETVLSAMEIFTCPGWAAVYAGNLKKDLVLPSEVRRVVIAADNDESGTGQRNAIEAAQRWKSEGRAVRIAVPKTHGDDFNDVLVKRRG